MHQVKKATGQLRGIIGTRCHVSRIDISPGELLVHMAVFLLALLTGLGVHDRDAVRVQEGHYLMTLGRSSEIGSRREPPMPPGENGPG